MIYKGLLLNTWLCFMMFCLHDCVHTGAHLDPGLYGKGKRIRRTRVRAVRIRSPDSAATAATTTTAADGLRPPSPRTARTARQPMQQRTNQPLPRPNRAGMSRPSAAGVTISHHPAGLVLLFLCVKSLFKKRMVVSSVIYTLAVDKWVT